MNIKSGFAVWLLVLVSTVLACAICIRWIDFPVAYLFQSHAKQFGGLERGLGSSVLVTGELVLLAVLALIRLIRGYLPEHGNTLFVATLASLASFDANDYILKVIFGRQNPPRPFRWTIVFAVAAIVIGAAMVLVASSEDQISSAPQVTVGHWSARHW
jgi:hypothetical protein